MMKNTSRGDRIMLSVSKAGGYYVLQLEDTLAPALVYVTRPEVEYRIPHGDDRIVFSPKSFSGRRHLTVRASPPGRGRRAAEPWRSIPTTDTAIRAFTRMRGPMWKHAGRLCSRPTMQSTAFMKMALTANGLTRAGASTGTRTRNGRFPSAGRWASTNCG